MTKEEYRVKITEIEDRAEEEKGNIAREFALSHSSVKVGDTIECSSGLISVRVITVSSGSHEFYEEYPQCIYFGPDLADDGALIDEGKFNRVYQQTVIKTKNEDKKFNALSLVVYAFAENAPLYDHLCDKFGEEVLLREQYDAQEIIDACEQYKKGADGDRQ